MLSRDHSRRLAQLERQLRRDDPDFCARMTDLAGPMPGSVPALQAATAGTTWLAALVLGVAGLWIPAAIAAVCAAVIVGMMISRH